MSVLTQAVLASVAASDAGDAATLAFSTMGAPTVAFAGIGSAPV